MTDIEEEDEAVDPDPRLPRGYLELDVDLICKEYERGEHKLPEGKFLTPHMVGTLLIADANGERKRPSSGAIHAVFKRWETAGYAEFRQNPYAFTQRTMPGKLMGTWKVYRELQDDEASDNATVDGP